MVLQEYYRTIRASLAVVPAFASDVYYTKKASSSVAAAMVCGTPLLADRELLAHYPYLSKVPTWPVLLCMADAARKPVCALHDSRASHVGAARHA